MLFAAISATFSSYWSAPITESLSQEKGTPSVPLSAITPSRILIDGRSVKVALAVIVFFNTLFDENASPLIVSTPFPNFNVTIFINKLYYPGGVKGCPTILYL